jgi:hypothetical protein
MATRRVLDRLCEFDDDFGIRLLVSLALGWGFVVGLSFLIDVFLHGWKVSSRFFLSLSVYAGAGLRWDFIAYFL